MTQHQLTVRDERLWHGDQSLRGSLIVTAGTWLFRARIKRDAYDFQSDAVVETWCQGRGWEEVQRVPITDLPIVDRSYVMKKPELWHTSMRESLRMLCELGLTILRGAA
jgi:hypothetical protein